MLNVDIQVSAQGPVFSIPFIVHNVKHILQKTMNSIYLNTLFLRIKKK